VSKIHWYVYNYVEKRHSEVLHGKEDDDTETNGNGKRRQCSLVDRKKHKRR